MLIEVTLQTVIFFFIDTAELLKTASFFCPYAHTQAAHATINAFHKSLKDAGLLELTDGISEFYTSIEVEGYKIAHYLGFLFADHFLPLVIPGYAPDSVITNTYAMLLSRVTGFNLFALENEIYQEFFRRAGNE